jgi:protein-S-isoprenylcysteine O-methyltransferase Ste14
MPTGSELRDDAAIHSILKGTSLAALLLMVLALAALILRHSLFSRSPIVIAVQCAAFALMIWARVTFGRRSFHAAANPTRGGLVTTGPYRFIRHPIYTAACIFGWAGVLAHWSAVNVLLGVLLLTGGIVRMLCEERLVAATYPQYRQYAEVTKRMVPYIF